MTLGGSCVSKGDPEVEGGGGKEAGMNFVQTHTFTAVIMSPAPFRDTTSLHFVEKKTVALCLNVERTQDH